MYNITQFSQMTGVAVKTLQKRDRDSVLIAGRTPTNRRFYTDEHLAVVRGKLGKSQSLNIVYSRVSSQAQKPGLVNQKDALEKFCAAQGIAIDEFVEEIGSGLKFKRPKLQSVLLSVMQKRVARLVVAHKDRLSRFGFDIFVDICQQNGCELIVMNQESLSPQAEIVQDLMTIVHAFSSRLYGRRNYRKTLDKALENDSNQSAQDKTESDAGTRSVFPSLCWCIQIRLQPRTGRMAAIV